MCRNRDHDCERTSGLPSCAVRLGASARRLTLVDLLMPARSGIIACDFFVSVTATFRGRPHMALGRGVPDPPPADIDRPHPNSRHRRGESYAVRAIPILGGLHYSLVPDRCVIEFPRTTSVDDTTTSLTHTVLKIRIDVALAQATDLNLSRQ